jgi:hypothetical protein
VCAGAVSSAANAEPSSRLLGPGSDRSRPRRHG